MIQVISCNCFCERGIRENNEDYISTAGQGGRIFVLCDGMGGHGHGEVASETACKAVFQLLVSQAVDEYTEEMLQDAVAFAQEEIDKADMFGGDERRMGTTLVVVAVNDYEVLVGHIGDSRCYLFGQDGKMKFRTKDHSQIEEAMAVGLITEDEAFHHPKKNIITRCLMSHGESHELTVDRLKHVQEGDFLLLCTDGVNDALRNQEIEELLSGEGSTEERLGRLREACAEKSRDNYSAILLQLHAEDIPPMPVPDAEDDEVENVETGGDEADDRQPSEPGTMQYCPNCGRPHAAFARFCESCGMPLRSNDNSDKTHQTTEIQQPAAEPVVKPVIDVPGEDKKKNDTIVLPIINKPVKKMWFWAGVGVLAAAAVAATGAVVHHFVDDENVFPDGKENKLPANDHMFYADDMNGLSQPQGPDDLTGGIL